jgi:hypothetical protein
MNLFLNHHTFDELRSLCRTTHQAQYQRFLKQAASYHDWLPPIEHPSKSITFIGMAAANLALAYKLNNQPEFLVTLQKWLDVAIGYPHWGKERMPDHDLDAAWLLFGLSLAYDWVGDDLPEEDRIALHDKLLLQGQRLYDFALETEGEWWSSAYWQNHNWICFAGLATVAYALQNEHPETQQWSQRALDNFQIVFGAMPEDGSNSEGVVYWSYGVLWLMIYADLAAQQEEVDLYQAPFLQNTFYYRLYMSGPNLIDTANFGDCHDRRSAHSRAMYYWMARHHHNGHAQWLAKHFEGTGEWDREGHEGLLKPGLLPQAFLDLLWYDPSVAAQPIDELPLSRCFPDLGLVGARTSWSPEATFLAFKSSVPLGRKAWALAHDLMNNYKWDAARGGHLHPDENSFILIRGDDYLAIDEGYSEAKQSIQHNTVLVDGRGQYNGGIYHIARGLGVDWGAQLETTFAAKGVVYARGDAAGAYAPELGLRSFKRQILLWDEKLVFLHDTLAADQPRKFEWLLQTDACTEMENSNQFTMRVGESQLGLAFVAPAEIVAENREQEVVAVPTSAEPDNILRRVQHTLSVSPAKSQESTRFFAVLTPGEQEDEPTQVEQLNCSNGLGARISKKNQQTLAGFALDARFWGAGNIFGTDAPWLAVSSIADDQISKLAVGESTRTHLQGQLWCAASNPACFAFQDSGWQIQSAVPTWVSVRVPKGSAVEFNGITFEHNVINEMARLQVPSGVSSIFFK